MIQTINKKTFGKLLDPLLNFKKNILKLYHSVKKI